MAAIQACVHPAKRDSITARFGFGLVIEQARAASSAKL